MITSLKSGQWQANDKEACSTAQSIETFRESMVMDDAVAYIGVKHASSTACVSHRMPKGIR